MTDRELLELAAKAACIEYRRTADGTVIEYFGGGLQLAWDEVKHNQNTDKWNPLTDDGDALRLAAKLKFDIEWDFNEVSVNHTAKDDGDDPYAATRRAIVRAAASIGGER